MNNNVKFEMSPRIRSAKEQADAMRIGNRSLAMAEKMRLDAELAELGRPRVVVKGYGSNRKWNRHCAAEQRKKVAKEAAEQNAIIAKQIERAARKAKP